MVELVMTDLLSLNMKLLLLTRFYLNLGYALVVLNLGILDIITISNSVMTSS